MDEQEGAGLEWETVQMTLNELRQGCSICWLYGQCEEAENEEACRSKYTGSRGVQA